MDTAWIQVFVLMLSECVAPAGKTVCQEREFELQFLSQSDCEFALQQLVSLKQESEKVIIDPAKASCVPSARQQRVYASADSVREASSGAANWKAPDVSAPGADDERALYEERLARLPFCNDEDVVAPCRVGDIIIEAQGSGEPVEVWRRD